MNQIDATDTALNSLSSIPRETEGPVFNAPWEAEVFAMTLSLHEQGLFTWIEWADGLSREISLAQQSGDLDRGDTYYLHWLAALEKMVVSKQIGEPGQLARLYAAWDTAAMNTPHGKSIELD